ncbi:hypothetical protein Tco_0402373, partial [Tanacetum coccineum]
RSIKPPERVLELERVLRERVVQPEPEPERVVQPEPERVVQPEPERVVQTHQSQGA